MNCPSCGVKLPPGTDFCMYCGSQIGGPDPHGSEPEPNAAPEPDPPAEPEEPAPRSQRGPWGSADDRPASDRADPTGQRGPWAGDYEFPETDETAPQADYEFPSGAPRTPAPERKPKPKNAPPPAPPDTMTRWQKIIVFFAVATLLGIFGTYWLSIQEPSPIPETRTTPTRTEKQTAPAPDASNRSAVKRAIETAVGAHLAALKQGDISGAYDQMSSVFREESTVREFAAFVQSHQSLWSYERITIGRLQPRNDIMKAPVVLSDQRGRRTRVTFELVFERKRWRVLNIAI